MSKGEQISLEKIERLLDEVVSAELRRTFESDVKLIGAVAGNSNIVYKSKEIRPIIKDGHFRNADLLAMLNFVIENWQYFSDRYEYAVSHRQLFYNLKTSRGCFAHKNSQFWKMAIGHCRIASEHAIFLLDLINAPAEAKGQAEETRKYYSGFGEAPATPHTQSEDPKAPAYPRSIMLLEKRVQQWLGEKTKNFKGRVELLDKIEKRIESSHFKTTIVTGEPGWGKSSLSASLYDRLWKLQNISTGSVFPAIHRISVKEELSQEPVNAVLLWIMQLANSIGKDLSKECMTLKEDLDGALTELEKLLDHGSIHRKRVALILDGIDEASGDDQKRFLQITTTLAATGKAHVVTFSRRTAAFEGIVADFAMNYEDAEQIKDISTFIGDRLKEWKQSEDEREKMSKAILSRVGGNFLFADILVCSVLSGEYDSIGAIEKLPNEFKKYLDGTLNKLEREFPSNDEFVNKGIPFLSTLMASEWSIAETALFGAMEQRGIPLRTTTLVRNRLTELLTISAGDDKQIGFCHFSIEEFFASNEYVTNDLKEAHLSLGRYYALHGPESKGKNYGLYHFAEAGASSEIMRILGTTPALKDHTWDYILEDPEDGERMDLCLDRFLQLRLGMLGDLCGTLKKQKKEFKWIDRRDTVLQHVLIELLHRPGALLQLGLDSPEAALALCPALWERVDRLLAIQILGGALTGSSLELAAKKLREANGDDYPFHDPRINIVRF